MIGPESVTHHSAATNFCHHCQDDEHDDGDDDCGDGDPSTSRVAKCPIKM